MRFRRFIIENYKAVEYAEVPVGNDLIPLIGINESGKTTVLQAILAFDKLSDKYGGGGHLEYRNKYRLKDHKCSVAAEVVIDDEKDLDALSQYLKLPRGESTLRKLEEAYQQKQSLILKRDLQAKQYSLSGLSLEAALEQKLAKAIYRELPFVLYFDDFTDRIPESIDFIRKDNKKGYRLKRSKLAEWQRILEEIFIRATEGEHTLGDFIQLNDEDIRQGLLNDITDVLNEEIIEYWRRLKQVGSDLADDPGDLELILTFVDRPPKSFRFQFKVNDRSSERGRVFPIADRSKGFQWFFNFHMKLRFNPKYKRVKEGAIYLLDEPGSYLHASAQTELLSTLDDISKTNSILYCTHSQHLLDPEKINIGQVRIVEKEQSTIKVIPFGSAGSGHQGALSPLYDALHLKTGVFNRNIRRAVITEGVTDFYLLGLLMKYAKAWNFKRLDVIPGAGAQQLKDLISMSLAWAEDYKVLLDSDREGRRARGRYRSFFGERETEKFWLYVTPDRTENVKLEDFFSEVDAEKLLNLTGATSLKVALPALHYGSVEDARDFIQGLNEITTTNLSLLHAELESLNAKRSGT